jgi:hypothetical protein
MDTGQGPDPTRTPVPTTWRTPAILLRGRDQFVFIATVVRLVRSQFVRSNVDLQQELGLLVALMGLCPRRRIFHAHLHHAGQPRPRPHRSKLPRQRPPAPPQSAPDIRYAA